jgi:DNA-binding SARP family transcriptional activator
MTEGLQIHLLGGLHIALNGAPVSGFISNKVPALLAYLAVSRRIHSRESLATLLWGELSDADAKNNLRQALSNLRKFFEPHLIISREDVQFNPDIPYFLDVVAFAAHLHAGDLAAAVALYQGDFLAGFQVRDAPAFEEWVLTQQVQWHEQALRTLHELMVSHARRGEYTPAIDFGNRLLALDPWREEAHRQLMLLQARNGQRSAALAQYQSCRSILRKEFDTDPSAETTALYERIRASLATPRHNLPAATTGFVGRESEISELRRRLAAPENRLVTILGPGGVGKSRLALEVAAVCEPMFLNGVWFVPLATEQPAGSDQLALALASSLNCILSGPADPATALIAFLRQREMLLVLDNLEQWLDAVGWLAELLTQAAAVKILATSRQRLNLRAEQVYALAGLPTPPEMSSIPEQFAAGQLFLQRARQGGVDFAPTPADRGAIVRICRLVEGLPLGLELAAAWVNQLTCAEIAGQIERSLHFLTANYRDVSPRQASLQGVFAWSWQRLTPQEQIIFRRLAGFSGPFTREAARQVAEATPAILAALVDKSLVWRRGQLFQLHEVARQFGAEKLSQAGEMAQTQRRHALYYAQLLAIQGERLQGPDQPQALTDIEREVENITLAWQWLIGQGDVARLAMAMDGLYHFTAIRSRFRQALALFSAARLALQPLASSDDRAGQLTYGRLLAREGRFLSFLSRFSEANERLLESLNGLRAWGDLDEMAFVLGHLGGTARMQGQLEQAEQWLRECLALRSQSGNRAGQAVALLELAGVAFMAANYAAARDHCLQGLAIAEAIADLQTTAHLLTGLSLCYRELGQRELALDYGRRSQARYEALGDRYGVIQAALTLGELSRQMGNYDQAREFCAQAVTISREIDYRSGEADGHYRLGQIALAVNDLSLAQFHQDAALELAVATQELPLMLDVLFEIAGILSRKATSRDAAVVLAWLHHQPIAADQRVQHIAALLAGYSPSERAQATAQAKALSQAELIQFIRSCL